MATSTPGIEKKKRTPNPWGPGGSATYATPWAGPLTSDEEPDTSGPTSDGSDGVTKVAKRPNPWGNGGHRTIVNPWSGGPTGSDFVHPWAGGVLADKDTGTGKLIAPTSAGSFREMDRKMGDGREQQAAAEEMLAVPAKTGATVLEKTLKARPDRGVLAAYAKAQAALTAQTEAADADYARQRSELLGKYNLTESPEEQRLLAKQIAAVEQTRKNAHAAIRDNYASALAGANDQARQVVAEGRESAAEQRAAFRSATAEALASGAVRAGAGGPAVGGAAVMAGDLAHTGAVEAAVAKAAGRQHQARMRQLAANIATAQASAHTQTNELGAQLSASTRAAHAEQVAERIASERLAANAAYAELEQARTSRRDSLAADLASLGLQQAQYVAEERAAVREANTEIRARNAAARQLAGEAARTAEQSAWIDRKAATYKAQAGKIKSKQVMGNDVPWQKYVNDWSRVRAEMDLLNGWGDTADAEALLTQFLAEDEMRNQFIIDNKLGGMGF